MGEWAGLASGGEHSERAGGAGAKALRQKCPSSSDTPGLEGMEGRRLEVGSESDEGQDH